MISASPHVQSDPRSSNEPVHVSRTRLYDLLIRDDPELDTILMDRRHDVNLLQKLLAIILMGISLYGATVGLAAQFMHLEGEVEAWVGPVPLLTLPLALTSAFLLALMVCMPSFYFYAQLSGLDASFRLITTQALRVQARTSILLLGVLPVYTAILLATVVGVLSGGSGLIIFGLGLPYVVGLSGLGSLYRSLQRLSQVLPVAHRRRRGFLSWLVIAWSAVYTAVCPVALYWTGDVLTGLW